MSRPWCLGGSDLVLKIGFRSYIFLRVNGSISRPVCKFEVHVGVFVGGELGWTPDPKVYSRRSRREGSSPGVSETST